MTQFRAHVLAVTALVSLGSGCGSTRGDPASAGSGGGTSQPSGSGGKASVGSGGATASQGTIGSGGAAVASGGVPGSDGAVASGGVGPAGESGTGGGTAAPGGSGPSAGAAGGGTTAGAGGAATAPAAGTCPSVGTGPTPDATTRAKCTTDSTGIACHFGGDPGNYDVSFNLGGAAAGKTEVQAEHLREMLAEVDTPAGQKVRYSMTVNVREPEGQPDWMGASDGINGLDVYFQGPAPELDSIAYAPAAAGDVVLYIITDSTGCDQEGPDLAGWGQWLPQFLGAGIAVANYGNSGALSECSPATTPCRTDAPYYSFYDNPKMWPVVKSLLKPGDVVLIEFAHNDKNTPQAAFEANINTYIKETRAAGAIPVLATPIPRNNWTNATTMSPMQLINDTGVNLPATIRTLGTANNIPVIDLTARCLAAFSLKGESAVGAYYSGGNTHLSSAGANIVAGLLRDEIKRLNIFPLACYMR
jgi:lysophospholipase L1-like esterase